MSAITSHGGTPCVVAECIEKAEKGDGDNKSINHMFRFTALKIGFGNGNTISSFGMLVTSSITGNMICWV